MEETMLTGTETTTENTGVTEGSAAESQVGTTDQQTQTQTQTQVPQTQTQQSDMISKAEAQKAIQSRVNELNRYKQTLNRIAQLSGMNIDHIEAYLENYALQQQQGQQAKVDPQVLQAQATARNAGIVAMETKRMIEENELRTNPVYGDWDNVRDQVREYADQRGMSLQEAYWAVNGASRAVSLQKEAEQRALEAARRRGGLTAEGDGAVAELQKLGLTADEITFAKSVGMDPKEFAAYRDMSNLDDYQKSKRKR